MKLAVVIQRYGKEITGGSESLCRETMRRLARKHQITVYTSTALDYVTWKSHYAAGEENDDGVTIKRFALAKERDIESFNRYSEWIYANEHTDEDELRWLEEQGPHCPSLVEKLVAEQSRYDVIVFYTYLYYPTVAGLRAIDRPAVLVPTAHREPAALLRMYRDVYRRPEAMVFNTRAEKRLVDEMFSPRMLHTEVGGVGITLPARSGARARMRSPSLLYAGRIDAGKGCAELVEYFIRFRVHYMHCNLYLMGSLNMDLPRHPAIKYAGYLSEDQKFAMYTAADVTVVPSRFESLSIVALEAMACGRPILVNGACEVLRDHCLDSNGGLAYESFDEFGEMLATLFKDRQMSDEIGANGKRYVLDNYTWDKVLARYDRALLAAAGR